MKTSAQERARLWGFLGSVFLSTVTMVWLFWHYPRGTGLATLVVIAAFGVSARLANWIDSEGLGPEARRLLSDAEAGEDFPQ